jgi:small subunit ribosomal protein S16
MRMGKKKQPTYRVVAADARSPRNGRFIEIVGVYDPRPDPSAVRIDNDKAVGWLRKGAQPTQSVRKLLEISGAWEEFSGEPSTRPILTPKPAAEADAAQGAQPKAKPAQPKAEAKPAQPKAEAKPAQPKAEAKPAQPKAEAKPAQPKAEAPAAQPKAEAAPPEAEATPPEAEATGAESEAPAESAEDSE